MDGTRQLERSTLEAYASMAITIFIVVIPMHWWVQALLVGIIVVLAIDFSFHAPWFSRWSGISRTFICIISVAILITISWKPIYDQYLRDHQPLDAADMQEFGQELIDLSSDILAFSADRAKGAPPMFAKNQNPEENWAEGVHYREETAAIVGQRFGGRILSDLVRLKDIGVTPPFIVQASLSDDPSITGKWLAAIGQLLANGKSQTAITEGSDPKLWWNLVQ